MVCMAPYLDAKSSREYSAITLPSVSRAPLTRNKARRGRGVRKRPTEGNGKPQQFAVVVMVPTSFKGTYHL